MEASHLIGEGLPSSLLSPAARKPRRGGARTALVIHTVVVVAPLSRHGVGKVQCHVVAITGEVRTSNARASPSEKRRTVLVRPRRTGRAGRGVEASVWRRRGGSSSKEVVESEAEEEEKKRMEELEEGEERGDEPVPWHTLARLPKLVRREPRGEGKRKEKSRSRRDVSRTEKSGDVVNNDVGRWVTREAGGEMGRSSILVA
ncbi:hypothetical protein BJV78DRAFT_1157161 [Lactifluus subvellereus]|nr:hypothetical protein BJV78DRAFT_1157161 [Lactifluus subvellereus]